MIRIRRTIAVLAIAFSVALPSWALDAQTQGGLRFLSGGVGDGEIAEIKALAPSYSLKVQTADLAGQFIAGVHLTIRRDRSTILDTTMDGPYLLADLPAGTYRLRASFEGRVIERTVVIGQDHQSVELHW